MLDRSPVARLRNIHVWHSGGGDKIHALCGANLELFPGEMVALFGASGSGKSTLLHVLAGLVNPSEGSVHVGDTNLMTADEATLTSLRLSTTGLVFQDSNLVAQFTARENVEFILGCQGSEAPRQEAEALLLSLGVHELATRLPTDMSGGQRQRVAVARALAGNRRLILCDEPTGALDTKNSRLLFQTLATLARSEHVAILVATHDREAAEHAHRVIQIHDGRLE